MKLDAERVLNWLNLFDLELHGMENQDKLHASGHASGPEIFEVIRKIEPKHVFPIHTEKPTIFRDKCQQAILVKKDHTYNL